ncbi:MAG: hypothetical protein ACLQMH_18550 [Solirubrobacteraceae bacterium]
MIYSEVERTLVKSPPELWAELSDPDALARHLGELGDIRITRVEPESIVEWQAESASGSVHIKASGWGTRVTLRATRETPAPRPAASREPTGEETGLEDGAGTHDTAPDTDAPDTATPRTATTHTAALDTANPDTAIPDIANPVTVTPDTANPDTVTPDTAALDGVARPDTAALDLAALDSAAPGFIHDPALEPSSADAARPLLATGEQPEPEPRPAEVDASEVQPTQDPSDQPAPRLSLLARLLSWRRRNRVRAEVAERSDYAAADEQAQDAATNEPPTPVPMDPQPFAEARSEQGYPEPAPDAETPRSDPEPGPEAATTEATHEPEPEAPATEAAHESGPEAEPTAAARIEIVEELRIAEETAAEQVQAVLTSVLDRLGAAHHRPFSRA